jgi:sporulation protein YpjB
MRRDIYMGLKSLFFSIVIIISSGLITTYANGADKSDSLETLADQSLQFAKVDRREEAEQLLQAFSDKFYEQAVENSNYTMDEINIITIAYEEALQTVKNKEKTNDEVINEITKFRLALDAVHTDSAPLWTSLKDGIISAAGETKVSIQKQDSIAFQEKLNQLLSIYHILYPSLKIDVTPERFQQVDSHIQFIDQYRPQVFSDQSQADMNSLEGQLRDIFEEAEKDNADPSLWWVIISTGSIIILTLSYVGWKKYKAKDDFHTKKKEENF